MDNKIKASLLEYYYSNSDRNNRIGNFSGIKVQKFLFFYNAFSYLDNKNYTDEKLFAFQQGPVYFDIFKLFKEIEDTKEIARYLRGDDSEIFDIDKDIAETALNFVDRMADQELSDITHNFEVWVKKFKMFEDNEEKSNFKLSEMTNSDKDYLQRIRHNFSNEFLSKYISLFSETNCYLIEKENYSKIMEQIGDRIELFKIKSDANPIYLYMENEDLYID